MQKRGQVATFLVIGIVIILVIATAYGVYNFALKSDFARQEEKHTNVPLEIKPLTQALDSCTKRLTEQALLKIGLQGGQYQIAETEITTPYTPLGTTLQIVPNSDIKTAVWAQETTNGIWQEKIPTQEHIEQELEAYIRDNFAECQEEILPFTEEGFSIVTKGEPTTDITVSKNAIETVVTLPITVTIKEISFPLETHIAKVETQFKDMLEAAQEIATTQIQEAYLENKTIDILIAYDEEVPFSGTTLSCTKQTWEKKEIEQKIREVLTENIAAITIQGTKNEGQEKFMQLPQEKKYPELTATLSYSSSWPTVVEIQERDETLESENIGYETATLTGALLTQYFCLDNHHVVYDIKYPVLITLTDSQGFIMQFVVQIIIDNNTPRQDTSPRYMSEQEENKICNYKTEIIEVESYSVTETDNLAPVGEVSIILKCGQATCGLGTTNGQGQLQTLAPQCANGILIAKKEGYHQAKTIVPGTVENSVTTVMLEPYYTTNIQQRIIDKKTGEIRDPYESETVTTTLQHQETGYTTTTDGTEPINLIAGDYKITTIVIGESTWPIVVPETITEKCINTKGKGLASFFATPEQCFTRTTESFELNEVIKGGVSYQATLKREMLSTQETIYIYTPAEPITADMEKIAQRYSALETNAQDPTFKYPHL